MNCFKKDFVLHINILYNLTFSDYVLVFYTNTVHHFYISVERTKELGEGPICTKHLLGIYTDSSEQPEVDNDSSILP